MCSSDLTLFAIAGLLYLDMSDHSRVVRKVEVVLALRSSASTAIRAFKVGQKQVQDDCGLVVKASNCLKSAHVGPLSFRVESNSQNRSSWSSPVGMWTGCI